MGLKERFRNIQKLPDWIFRPVIWILFLLRYIMRMKIIDRSGAMEAKNPPAVTVTWHNRLLLFPVVFPKWHRRHTVAVISASRDGQYIADIAAQAGVGSVRGSSRKGGINVLLEAAQVLRNGKYLAFTPDGPRGPRYRMSVGPVYLASTEQVPVIPLGIHYSSSWKLGSWDAFQIPKPWAKITVTLGEPVRIPKDLDHDGIELWRRRLEDALNEASQVTEAEIREAEEDARIRAERKAAKRAGKNERSGTL